MSRVINLDEKIAAKETVEKEPVKVLFRGREWTFVPSMPAQVPEMFADGKIVAALLLTLDPDQRDAFQELNISIDEAQVILEAFTDIYGVASGE